MSIRTTIRAGNNLITDFSGIKYPIEAEMFPSLELAQESKAPHLRINSPSWEIFETVTFDQDNQTVEFVGSGKISTTNPTRHGLSFTGNNALIINPYMQGPGQFVQDNSSDAALIYITGNDVEVRVVMFRSPNFRHFC